MAVRSTQLGGGNGCGDGSYDIATGYGLPPSCTSRHDGHAMTRAAILPLVVRDLCYEIGGKRLLDGICFRTDAGSRTMVLGPNGAGKSLFLRLCHGLLQLSAGTMTWAGAAPETARHCQAMVFQRPCSCGARQRRTLPTCCACRAYHVASGGHVDGDAGAGRFVVTGDATSTCPVMWGAATSRPGACLGLEAPGVVPRRTNCQS